MYLFSVDFYSVFRERDPYRDYESISRVDIFLRVLCLIGNVVFTERSAIKKKQIFYEAQCVRRHGPGGPKFRLNNISYVTG